MRWHYLFSALVCMFLPMVVSCGNGNGTGSDADGDGDTSIDTQSDGDAPVDGTPDPDAGADTDVPSDGAGDVDASEDAGADGDDATDAPPVENVCTGAWGTTWYVRPDGGDDTQCSGLVDAAYPGSGSTQPCAFSHPFFALPPSGTPRLQGGDRLVIASGEYRMGLDAPGDTGCEPDWPYECAMLPVPSGTSPDTPTCIVGEGWDGGCTDPPQLWGTERAWTVLDLTGSDNVRVECLEVTDHEDCVEFHSGAIECNRMGYPFGDWAAVGLAAADSTNVVLRDLDIHGLANRGILAGRLTDWTLEHVFITGNGWAGFDGDVEGDDSNSGTITFRDVTIAWNGCGETWPGREPTGCWGQSAGGYGDGLGTGSTGGDWVFEHCDISHNTSDGLDLLYHDQGGVITVDSVRAEGNAGNQVKTRGETHIVNSVLVGNCAFFDGQLFTHDVDNCRALGNTLSLDFDAADTITMVNSTLWGEGDCLVIVGSGCGATANLVSRNNVFLGATDFLQPFENTCFYYSECGTLDFDEDWGVIRGTKHDTSCPWGPDDICTDPLLSGPFSGEAFGMVPGSGSPAFDSGLAVGALGLVPAEDILGNARPWGTGVDRGAFEIAH